MPNEEILEAERRRVREEYDKEMQEIKQKFQSEQQTKAKMQEEVIMHYTIWTMFVWPFICLSVSYKLQL